MKSEHRHELQQNELGKLTRKVQPWFEKHGMQVVVGCAAALVAIVVVLWLVNTRSNAGSDAWTNLPMAQTTEDFAKVSEKYGDTLAGLWATLREAELNLENGVLDAFKDRELALTDLQRAKSDFEKVLAAKQQLPAPMKERALLGLARALETTSDGDTNPAVEAYQSLLKQFPETVYRTHVEQRIKELQTGDAKQFYTWFHAQKPKQSFSQPQDGAKTSTTPFNLELPELPRSPNPPGESTPADAPK